MAATRVTPDRSLVAEFAADYADAFCIPAGGHAPREWAAASLRGADAARGAFATLAWHGVLGFDLADRRTPSTLVGWRITSDDADRFVLDVDGRLMAARMAFDATDDVLTWTTMLRDHRPAAARVWSVAGHLHRALAPRCLDQARASLARTRRTAI